jgi:hypothetical protein
MSRVVGLVVSLNKKKGTRRVQRRVHRGYIEGTLEGTRRVHGAILGTRQVRVLGTRHIPHNAHKRLHINTSRKGV